MIQPYPEANQASMSNTTRSLVEQVNYLVSKLEVTYEVTLANKVTVATFYLTNYKTDQKFKVAIGTSEVFFEQRFDKALGEKYAYEQGLEKAKKYIEDFVFFRHFMNATDLLDSVSPITNI